MNFLQEFETNIGAQFIAPVTAAAGNVLSLFSPIFVAGFSIWIMLIGWEIAWGKSDDGIQHATMKIGRMFFIGTFALMGWPMVADFVNGIQQLMVSAMSGVAPAPGSPVISTALTNNLITPLLQWWDWMDASAGLTMETFGPFAIGEVFSKVIYIVLIGICYGLMWIVVSFVCVVTLVMYLMSFASFQMLMAIGPFFLLCLAFPFTQRFFETWTGAMITAALAMAFTAFLSVVVANLLSLAPPAAAPTAELNKSPLYITMLGRAGAGLLTVYLYYKVFDLASSLGGGMNMGNNVMGAMRNFARDLRSGGQGNNTTVNSIGRGRGNSPAAPNGGGGGGNVGRAISANRTLTGMGISAIGQGAIAGGRFAYNRGALAARAVGTAYSNARSLAGRGVGATS